MSDAKEGIPASPFNMQGRGVHLPHFLVSVIMARVLVTWGWHKKYHLSLLQELKGMSCLYWILLTVSTITVFTLEENKFIVTPVHVFNHESKLFAEFLVP